MNESSPTRSVAGPGGRPFLSRLWSGRRGAGRAVLAAALTAGVLLPTACGYFYKAQLAGYVKDQDTSNGIDGVLVTIFAEDPGPEGTAATAVTATPTNTSGGQAGFYSATVVWENLFGKYGKEGDTKIIYFVVTHPDYRTRVVTVPNILSGEANNVPDVELKTTLFTATQVTGQVVDVNGAGVDGVRVVLDLVSTSDEDTDYTATTGTVNGTAGTYQFGEVKWHDDTVTSLSDTEDATLGVRGDPNYQWQVSGADQTLAVQLVSGQDNEITDDVPVSRKPRTEFSANVTGRMYFLYTVGTEETTRSITGTEIRIEYSDTNGAHTVLAETNQNGSYTANVRWSTATPPAADPEVPQGEDRITVTINFAPSTATANAHAFDPLPYVVKSWLDPNQVPDQIDSNPDT